MGGHGRYHFEQTLEQDPDRQTYGDHLRKRGDKEIGGGGGGPAVPNPTCTTSRGKEGSGGLG